MSEKLKIGLTLKAEKSKIDNITLYEKIDIEILNKLIKSDLLKEQFNSPFAEYAHQNEREQLLEYKKIIKNGFAEVKYNKVKDVEYGRVSPFRALGLFQIRRQIRHTLAKGNFTDIDIVNCHPVLLLQICKANNLECENLEDYVNDRATYLKKVMTEYKVSRDDAKKLFIILLYFGSFESWAEDLQLGNVKQLKEIKNFKKEIQEIGKAIFNANPDILKVIKKRKKEQNIDKFNEIGSVVSYYLQEIECRILETLFLYCVAHKIIKNFIAVLCADGLMIETENYSDDLLKIFSDLINHKFGFKLEFTKKEMNEDYLNILDDHILKDGDLNKQLLNGYDNTLNIDDKQDFNIDTLTTLFFDDLQNIDNEKYIEHFNLTKSFKYFNHYHAHFYQTNQIYKIYNNNVVGYKDFKDSFNHLQFNLKKNNYKFAKMYDESVHKKKFSSFDFEPNRTTTNDKYNLFNGFVFDKKDVTINDDDIKIYLDHVLYLSNGNEEVYNYILNWMAHVIQKPERKTNVALVLYSIVEGVGKNILFDIFEKLLEGYTAKFRDTNALTDKFNSDMMGKLFVIGDEINARAQEVANELKDIITRTKENIEFKGKDKFIVRDYKNYAFTTNNENVFKVSNSDRRFMFIECPEEKKTLDYYKNLVQFGKDNNKLSQLHHYFKNRDITNFNTENIIMTEYKKRLIMANLPAYIKFAKDEYFDDELEYTTSELYNMSIAYAKKNKLNSTYTEHQFAIQFKKVFKDFNKVQKQTYRSVYLFPSDKNIIIDVINKNYIFS